jgi:cell division protease FtsH
MSSAIGPQTFGRQSGNIFLGHDLVQEKEYSEETAVEIDKEVSRVINESYAKAKSLVEKNRDKLDILARKLEEKEVLEGNQILELLNLKKERKEEETEEEKIAIENKTQ